MTIEQIIQKAYDGGLDRGEYSNLHALLLKPIFWQSLGKGMRWSSLMCPFDDCWEVLTTSQDNMCWNCLEHDEVPSRPEWLKRWHWFIDHLAENWTIEEAFATFRPPEPEENIEDLLNQLT